MLIIGHRGARGLAPENTISALKKGLTHHVDMLEFDLRVTKDNIVVLHHDPYITDPNGDQILIGKHSYDELLTHKADLPTFKSVLQKIGHTVPLYVEVKPYVPTAPIVNIIEEKLSKGWQPDHFRLASFSQKTLLELHEALPEIETIVLEKWSGVRAHHRARQLNTKTICMNQKWLWSGFIRGFKNRPDWQLYTYTLNNVARARRWERAGLAGVVTDYPDRYEK